MLAAVLTALTVSVPARAQSNASFDSTVRPFLTAHCSTCHNALEHQAD